MFNIKNTLSRIIQWQAWVVDGLKQFIYTTNYQVIVDYDENSIQSLNLKQKTSFLDYTTSIIHATNFFNINWGWGGSKNNWYVDDDARISYRYSKDIITIRY